MLYTTHMVTSLLAGTALNGLVGLNGGIPYYAGTLIGSLLPDIDHPKSFIGQRSLGIAHIIHKLCGHRGLTHSLLFTGITAAISFLTLPSNWAMGLAVGYAGHLLGDFFSVSGIPLLAPFSKKKYKLPIYKTGGLSETIILIISGLLLGWLTLL
jgi:inner membrane protein